MFCLVPISLHHWHGHGECSSPVDKVDQCAHTIRSTMSYNPLCGWMLGKIAQRMTTAKGTSIRHGDGLWIAQKVGHERSMVRRGGQSASPQAPQARLSWCSVFAYKRIRIITEWNGFSGMTTNSLVMWKECSKGSIRLVKWQTSVKGYISQSVYRIAEQAGPLVWLTSPTHKTRCCSCYKSWKMFLSPGWVALSKKSPTF